MQCANNTHVFCWFFFLNFVFLLVYARATLCGLEFCMTISIDNKIEIQRPFILISRFVLPLQPPLLPHPPYRINTEIDDHTLNSHVFVVTKFSSIFHSSFWIQKQLQHHPTSKKNNYINSLAESCRHRVKLFAIFLNLHILAAKCVCAKLWYTACNWELHIAHI